MTRVAFLLDAIPVSGGAERLVFQTLLAIDRARVECTLIITRWDQEVAASGPGAHILQELETAGVRVIGIRRTSRLSPRTWWAIVRTLRTHRIEVIHSHMFGSNLHAVVTGRIAGVPVIAHEHGLRSSLSVKRRLADRHLIGRLATVVLCVSEADRNRLVRTEGLPEGKVRFIPLGIPAQGSPPIAPADARRELGLDAAGIVVVATAMLRPEKRLDLLLAAVASLGSATADVALVIVGDGAERGALEAQAARLSLGRRVRFLGKRTDVARVLAAADIGVLCSDREGTPLAVLEYMQAGLAIVATAVGGIPAAVRHEQEGLLVPPGSAEAVAQGITRLCDDAQLRRSLGEAARERCRRKFDIGHFADTLEGLYRSIAAPVGPLGTTDR